MNPYLAAVLFIGVPVVIVGMALLGTWLTDMDWDDVRSRRAQRRSERQQRKAQANARWQDSVSTEKGLTRVSVRKVGRFGKRPEDVMVLEEHELGSIRESDANADDKISELWQRAQLRAVQLNSGPMG